VVTLFAKYKSNPIGILKKSTQSKFIFSFLQFNNIKTLIKQITNLNIWSLDNFTYQITSHLYLHHAHQQSHTHPYAYNFLYNHEYQNLYIQALLAQLFSLLFSSLFRA